MSGATATLLILDVHPGLRKPSHISLWPPSPGAVPKGRGVRSLDKGFGAYLMQANHVEQIPSADSPDAFAFLEVATVKLICSFTLPFSQLHIPADLAFPAVGFCG